MKQTVMQQAIKEIADLWSSPGDTPTYTQIFNVLENKLEMEKQQIIESYCQGCFDVNKDNSIFPRETSEQYYNETFNK